MTDLTMMLVRRQLAAADAELERLKLLASIAGALPGEIAIVWRFQRGRGGLWPFLR